MCDCSCNPRTSTESRKGRQLCGPRHHKIQRHRIDANGGQRVAAPLVAECFANLECKLIDKRLVKTFNLFVLAVIQAWRDPKQRKPKTIHHHG
jgi:flavin reductase (DIM6/NTAB) family NADH-FMN oxidoreductase RutF